MDAIATITTEDNGQTYEVPESCIGSAADAREVIGTLIKSENIRSKRRARFNGMINGNPPWPKLIDQGQDDRANFSRREAEGFMAGAKTPYYKLFFGNSRFIRLTLDYGGADPGTLETWASKIATRYQYALQDWKSLDMNAQHSQFQMIAHGNGPVMWEDDYDWRSDSRNAGDLMLPDDASADIDKWDTAGCKRSYLPTDLWRKIQKTGSNWNKKAVQRAIMSAAPESFQGQFGQEWERYEAEIRKGIMSWNSKSKRIFVADLFQKEFTGQISHFIILRTADGTPEVQKREAGEEEDPSTGFLYRKLNRFDSFCQIVAPFIYDVGPDKQWHSVKGAGPKIFDFYSASDRLFCRSLDGGMKASGVITKAKDANALLESPFTDVSGGTVIGPGYETMQQRVAPDLQSPLLLMRELKETLSQNTGQYFAHYKDEPAPTLGQEQITQTERNVLNEGDASRYQKQLDRWHEETFRRILAMGEKVHKRRPKKLAPSTQPEVQLTPSEQGALKFYRGCLSDGIPEEILKIDNFCQIQANRLVGNGSQQMRMVIGDKLMSILPMVDERGRNFILRTNIAAWSNDTYADAIVPAYDTPQMADDNISVAALENNALKLPQAEVEITPSQDHAIHFASHGQSVANHAQAVQGGQADPHGLLIHLENAGGHMAKHLKAIEGDPTRKEQTKSMAEQLNGMSKMTDQLTQQLQEADAAAAANQPQQQPDPELVKGLTQIQQDSKLKETKMLLDQKRKDEKQNFDLRSKDIAQAHDMKLKNVETAHKILTAPRPTQAAA